MNITYRFGPYFKVPKTKVRLNVNVENVVKKITNVIGTVNGSVEPDRIVLLGAHRDSWSYGAVDAVSATAVMIEISRAVGVLLKSGWRPRRTIQFCSWSAEEYALIGSTEWVEENSKLLSERAVAYLNLDLAVNGNFTLRTFSSPLLNQLILDALKDVTDPTSSSSSQSIYEVMANREPSAQGMKPKLRTLGTVSDYASFYQYLGIPSIDWGYYFSEKNVETFPYPVYHSSVETFEWVKKFVDPQFKIHLAVAQLGGIFLIRLVDCPVLPMSSVSSYTPILRNSLQVLEVSYQDQFRAKNITLVHLKKAVEDFGTASTKFEEHLNQLKNENKNDFAELRILNDQIRYVEKSFLYPNGLPGRSEFKHLIFAPDIHNTYASASYPSITDAIFECEQKNCSDWEEIRFQISLVTHTIQQATVLLKPIL